MKHATIAAAFAAALLLPCLAQAQQKKLYCWEEEGRKICGDALPADAADNARTEFNARTGTKVGEVARALTDEERAALAAEEAMAALQADEEAERQRRELAMVESYVTEADLQRSFDNRLALMDDTLQSSRIAISSLRGALLTRLRRASELELAGKPVDGELAAAIASQHAALQKQRALLARQQEERAMLDLEMASAVSRYRELTGERQADEAPAAAPSEG